MIQLHKPFIPPWDELGPALQAVFESGQISQGGRIEEFERRFSDFVGSRNVVAVSSCTAALHLALVLAGVGPGDEVVSTPMTAEPTNLAIHHAGARVRWADVDPTTGNVTAKSLNEASSVHPKAIMVVHYGGIPVRDFKSEIPIIEDCAHALGASPIGWGDFQCYSFQAIKHLTTIEGGALVMPGADEETMRRARRLRWFGIDRSAARTNMDIAETGWKYNMTEVQAAVGLTALKHMLTETLLPDVNMINGLPRKITLAYSSKMDDIKKNCLFYDDNLNCAGLSVVQGHGNPLLFYTVLAERRDDLARKLRERGVECGQVHRRNDEHTVFAYAKRPLLGLDAYYSKFLHIPCGWWVRPEDRQYIVDVIRGGW